MTAAISDHLAIGVFAIDQAHRICYWNRWLAVKTEVTEQEALGKTLPELFPNSNNARFMWAVEQVIARRSPQVLSQALNRFLIPIPIEYVGRHGVTMMQQHCHVEPMTSEDGMVRAVVSVIDVTENVTRSSALTEMAHKLQQDSNRDPLTGMYNRRFLWEWLVQQLRQCARYEYALGALMFDIDHFKRINDAFGHDRGDVVLRQFAQLVAAQLRESDVLVRYGGEEFVALLPHCDLSATLEVAQRVMQQVRETAVAGFDVGEVSCSIGAAAWVQETGMTGEELLKQADKRLYEAKNRGRNCVVPGQPQQATWTEQGRP